MRGLGIRLGVAGGPYAVLASALVTLAVAVGTAFLLLALSIAPALQARADRTAWAAPTGATEETGTAGTVTVSSSVSYIGDQQVRVVAVAGTGPGAPVPPGISRLPGPGEAFVSPAVSSLISDHPQVAGRYGTIVGTIQDDALQGPDHLIVVKGTTPEQAALDGETMSSFPTQGSPYQASGIERLALSVGALSLLFPIGLLVAIATRLTATTRQRRMAALSLLGASSGQLRQVAAGEAFLPGVVGALLGVVLWLLGRPLAARASYDGTTFFPSDLTPGPFAITAVVVAVPVVCIVSASLSMRHARISPLEVAHSRPSRAARPWCLVPLAAAIVGGALALWSSRSTGQVPASLVTGAYALILTTLLLAGPELTRLAGRGLSRLPGAAALLAGNRLRDHPDAGFLPVAGVSLAILATMAFVAITPAAARSLAATEEVGQRAGTGQAAVEFATPAQSAQLVIELGQLPGVGDPTAVISAQVTTAGEPLSAWIGNCQAITAAAAMTDVPCGQAMLIAGRDVLSRLSPDQPLELYNMRPAQVLPWTANPDPSQPEGAHLTPPRPAATMPAQRGVDMPDLLIDPALLDVPAEAFRPTLVLFRYDSPAALESARTLVESQVQSATIATRATTFEGFSQDVRRLYDAISLASIALAIISASALVLAAAASLVERRRPYMLLRMAGTPLATLRRAVFLESATPLLVTGTLAALLGGGVGWGVTALGDDAAYPLGGVLLAPLAILLVSLTVLSAIAFLVERLTRGNEVRFE